MKHRDSRRLHRPDVSQPSWTTNTIEARDAEEQAVSYSQAIEAQLTWLRWIRRECRSGNRPEWLNERLAFTETALETGETYYWSPEIGSLIASVAASLPMTWQFAIERLPSQRGFFWFPSGLTVDGSEFGVSPMHALAWSIGVSAETGQPAANVSAFFEQPGKPADLRSYVFTQGMTAREAVLAIALDADEMDMRAGFAMAAIFASCLAFLEQRILVAPQRRAERHTRKRLEREGFPYEPVVRVIELRRKQVQPERHGDPERVEWSHRWIVSGHWRQQWYPSLNTNQPIWVMPYVKGPENKPLKPPRAKVFAVVR